MRKTIHIIEDLDKGININELAPNPNAKEEAKDADGKHNGANTGEND